MFTTSNAESLQSALFLKSLLNLKVPVVLGYLKFMMTESLSHEKT